MSVIDPVKIRLTDGTDRLFLLTMRPLKLAASAIGLPIHRALVEKPLEFATSALYHSMLAKDGLTEEAFEDMIRLPDIMPAFDLLKEASFPNAATPDPVP